MLGGGEKQQERCVEDAGRDVHEDPAAKPTLLTSPDSLGWVTLYVMLWLMKNPRWGNEFLELFD